MLGFWPASPILSPASSVSLFCSDPCSSTSHNPYYDLQTGPTASQGQIKREKGEKKEGSNRVPRYAEISVCWQ